MQKIRLFLKAIANKYHYITILLVGQITAHVHVNEKTPNMKERIVQQTFSTYTEAEGFSFVCSSQLVAIILYRIRRKTNTSGNVFRIERCKVFKAKNSL